MLSANAHILRPSVVKVISKTTSLGVGKFSTSASAFSSSKAVEHDLLHRSILPSDHFQKSLPKVKVPKLEDSLKRYLASQEAFLSAHPDDLKVTRSAVEEFAGQVGPALQTEVEQFAKANPHTSYVTDYWFDMYLRDRQSVVLTHQPVMFFQDSQRGPQFNQVDVRATNMVYSAIRLMRSYRANVLDPDMFHLNPAKSDNDTFRKRVRYLPKVISWYGAYLHKVYPLDMSQMVNLFNSTRIPLESKDCNFADPTARHLLVIRKGRMYVFDILDEQDRAVSPDQILSNIQNILALPEPTDPHGLGIMTAAPRDTWAAARQRLIAMGNEEELQLVDTAAYALVLDELEFEESDHSGQIHNFLHGPAQSRWFDKSLSLLLSPTGRAAVTFEHSWGDGVAVLRFFNEVWKDSDTRPVVTPDSVRQSTGNLPSHSVRPVNWKLDKDFLDQYLKPTARDYDEKRGKLNFCYAESPLLSKALLKKAKLSPDAMMQLSFQLAYDKLHSGPPATYESCSTSAFRRGRTETVRPATSETVAMTQMLHSVGGVQPSNAEMFAQLQACSKKHGKLTIEAAMGSGWDRHLTMLKHFATFTNEPLPCLFADPSYSRINHIILSTSTLSSDALLWGAFAAVTHDGYGAGYGIRDHGCGLGVSTWAGAPTSNGEQFIEAFLASVKEIADVIAHN